MRPHTPPKRPPFLRWTVLVHALFAVLLLGAAPAPPDLRLEWSIDGRHTRRAEPVVGCAGCTVTLRYQLRNVGGSDAFAVVLTAHTALGQRGRAVRLRPGPAAGRGVNRTLDLPVAVGMREVCIEARLQTLGDDEPRETQLDDNTLCRRIEVREASGAASRGADAHLLPGDPT